MAAVVPAKDETSPYYVMMRMTVRKLKGENPIEVCNINGEIL